MRTFAVACIAGVSCNAIWSTPRLVQFYEGFLTLLGIAYYTYIYNIGKMNTCAIFVGV